MISPPAVDWTIAKQVELENATNLCAELKADRKGFSHRSLSSDVHAGAATRASLGHGTGPAAAATADPLENHIAVHNLRCQIASDPGSFFDKADVDTSWDISTEEWIEVCKLNGPQNAANLESLFKETALHVGTTGSRSQGSRTLQIRPI